jgi:hypothetical protein
MSQDVKDKFIGCSSYLRRRREKAKTRSGLRFSILLCASYQVATDTLHILNHTAHPMGTGLLSVCRLFGTDFDLCFFPASGNRNGTGLNNRGSNGNYWSSSLNSQTNGYNLNFNSTGVNPANNNNRFNGFSVRAVQHSSIEQSMTKITTAAA